MCADAPDTSGINAAAEASSKLGKEQFDWFKAEYDKTQGQRDATQARANEISDAQLASMNLSNTAAKESYDRYKSTFQPLEDKAVADAQDYDTAGRRAEAAATARADVEAGYGSAQDSLQRTLARQGVSTGGGRSLALMQDAALSKGAAIAGATNKAVKDVEAQGYARKMDAIGIGKGVVSNQATQQQIATSTGNSSVGNSGMANQAGMSGAGLMQTGFSGAMQGYGQAGNLYGQAAQIQQSTSGSELGALGTIAGAAIKYAPWTSDKTVKSDTGKKGNPEQALSEINSVPVEEGWRYDPAKGGPDDGGVPHTGPMAQDVRAKMGEQAAPGGKMLDPVTMNGKLMLGMQALTKRLEKLEKRV